MKNLSSTNIVFLSMIIILSGTSKSIAQYQPDSIFQITSIGSSYPSWSPDGLKIIFHSNRSGNSDIYVMNSDGSGLVQLTDDSAEDYTPVWSPRGNLIAFQSDRDGNREIYLMKPDGSSQVNLTKHSAEDSHPKWSPDASKIIFDSDRTNPDKDYELFEMNSDGSKVRRLTDYGDWDTYSSISPDESKILWRRVTRDVINEDTLRNSEVFVMDRDGSNIRNLTNHPAYDGWPCWSPDGTHIVFASDRDKPREWNIYIMKSDGTSITRLTPETPGARYTRPSWSPDGSKIACNITKDDNTDIVIISLHQVRNQSVRFTRVLTGDIVNDQGQSRGLAWSDYDNDGDADLYVTNTGGQWNFFYKNNGNGTFSKMRGVEVVRHRGFSEGVNWVDYDNDGDLDLFVANTFDWETGKGNEPNFLFRNDVDSGFVQVYEGPLVEDKTNSASACWADFNNDGLLDVFVVNQGDENDALFMNEGEGRFIHVLNGIAVSNGGNGRMCACGDVDGDKDIDLYIGNFAQRNFFYLNDGGGNFSEIKEGHFVTNSARTYSVSFVDYDYDDDLDLMVSNIGRNDRNYLYQNNGKGNFTILENNAITDHQKYSGDGGGASKGHAWGDYDNDGDLDLYIANGTYQPDMRNFMFLNDEGRFIRFMDGRIVTDTDTSAGTAWADYDNDGDLDLFVVNWGSDDQDNALYRNDAAAENWVSIQLEGRQSNRFGIGTKIRLKAKIKGKTYWQTRWMLPNTGYASQNDYNIHFGLGDATKIMNLEIYWTSGQIDKYINLEPNRFLIAVEGEEIKLNERKLH